MALVITVDQCTSCGICASTCPEGAIARGNESFVIDPKLCTECEECQLACPAECIQRSN